MRVIWMLGMAWLIGWQGGCTAPQPVPPAVPCEPAAPCKPAAPHEPAAPCKPTAPCTPASPAQPAEAVIDPMLAVNTLKPAPPNFLETRLASGHYPIPAYAKYLTGVRICLDPGHGGDAQQRAFKRGPSGVREAEVNLRLAQYLRALLARSGAEVRLTREDDSNVGLSERAAIANDWPADLFISLHHNANEQDPAVNRTTVWYHAGVDYRPSSLDLARYLCYALYDGLGLAQFADVPLCSDQLMYNIGFAVLRETNMTGALTESSYFTNPAQEQLLREPEYNLREAYALFMGLAKYAAAGLPRARLIEPENATLTLPPPCATTSSEAANSFPAADSAEAADAGRPTDPLRIILELDDGLRSRQDRGFERQMILSDSIVVRVDGQQVPHTFTNDDYRLEVELPADLAPGAHEIRVDFQNMNKNSVLNPLFKLAVVP